jgi:hypothetical protein
MWYLILLLLYSLVGSANRYSEECFLWGRAESTGVEFMESGEGRWPEKNWEQLCYSKAVKSYAEGNLEGLVTKLLGRRRGLEEKMLTN